MSSNHFVINKNNCLQLRSAAFQVQDQDNDVSREWHYPIQNLFAERIIRTSESIHLTPWM